jgi:anti-sigma28 factor (negative regulator of flagellin synthesis)
VQNVTSSHSPYPFMPSYATFIYEQGGHSMSTQARVKRLKTAIAEGKHPLQQPIEKRQKRAQQVADKIIALAQKEK